MVDFVVYVHQDIPAVDVKFEMHVKVIHAWMVVHANLSIAILAIIVYALVALAVHGVKLVRLSNIFMRLELDALYIFE